MTPRQLDELMSIRSGDEFTVMSMLRESGRARAEELLEKYEERIGIIAEARDPTPDEVTRAWSSVLGCALGVKRN